MGIEASVTALISFSQTELLGLQSEAKLIVLKRVMLATSRDLVLCSVQASVLGGLSLATEPVLPM